MAAALGSPAGVRAQPIKKARQIAIALIPKILSKLPSLESSPHYLDACFAPLLSKLPGRFAELLLRPFLRSPEGAK